MTTLSVDGRWYAGEMIYKRDGHFKFDSTELFDAYAVVQVLYSAPLVYALNLYYQRFWGVNTPKLRAWTAGFKEFLRMCGVVDQESLGEGLGVFGENPG